MRRNSKDFSMTDQSSPKPPSLPSRQRSMKYSDEINRSSFTTAATEVSTSRRDSRTITSRGSRSRESKKSHRSPIQVIHSGDELSFDEDLETSFKDLDTSFSQQQLTKDKVRAFIHDYYEDYGSLYDRGIDCWNCFFDRYFSPGFVQIRPSGNPIGTEELAKLFTTDVKLQEIKLVSIDSVTLLSTNMSAVVVYTCDQVFTYKGIPNDDRAVMSCVLEVTNGEIKIAHEHRSSGNPIPKKTRWESSCSER